MRLIDADRLCEDLLNRWSMADSRKEELIRQVMADIVTPIVVSQPTVNQWIPVSERLPEEGIEVLGTDDHGCIRHVVKDKSALYEFATYEEMMHINIVAWQPLPEPYKEEKNDKSRYL